MQAAKLYYVYDPMCSWCWGYKPTWEKIQSALADEVTVQYVVGGLAPDSMEPMPIAMREQIASYWKKIENYLGTEFNYDFWTKNTPKRSTYPSCRAVLAARKQGAEKEMLRAIQHAYYLQARNPSDSEVLIAIAAEIGLDEAQFLQDFQSEALNQQFMEELGFARSIGGNSFPSLFVETANGVVELPVDYESAQDTIEQIHRLMA
ncbi:DsbA family protein [Vibrio coralliilyticus]|uniref:DsbA family protein n=1 Tax=Vibrio coralliilyticus TaxID=190893 RepID=UPI0018145DFB|nr:DsbA family protein [Vibrio coralliilyticus]MCC2521819.1 DsbA family protein [Vibrio coralliilyticus]NUW70272.1 DsbA family protein [Vibrio coralliilyticus]